MINSAARSLVSGKKWYRNISAGNPLYSEMELISTTVVGSGGVSSVTFSSIPSSFKHLQVRYTGRSTLAAGVDNLAFTFNGDSGSNYSSHSLYGDGAGVYSNAFTSNVAMYIPSQFAAGSVTAGSFSSGVIDILDYTSTSKNKTTRTLNGYMGTSGLVSLVSSCWRSTSAITSITFVTSANLAANSRFSLYGIKG